MRTEFWRRLRDVLGERYAIAPEQGERLAAHWEHLERWNRRINLTAIRDMETAVVRHYAESVALAMEIAAGRWRVLDVGSGAGFPGFPFAVVRPECEVILLESDVRKAVFLEESTAGTANCRVLNDRLERVSIRCDWLISRAVSRMDLAGGIGRLADRIGLLVSATGAAEWAKEIEVEKDVTLLFRPEAHVLVGRTRRSEPGTA